MEQGQAELNDQICLGSQKGCCLSKVLKIEKLTSGQKREEPPRQIKQHVQRQRRMKL